MNADVCAISNEPGGDLVLRPSRLLPNHRMMVKKIYWDQGYEPRSIVIVYGQSLIRQAATAGQGKFAGIANDKLFLRIIEKKLYKGPEIPLSLLLV